MKQDKWERGIVFNCTKVLYLRYNMLDIRHFLVCKQIIMTFLCCINGKYLVSLLEGNLYWAQTSALRDAGDILLEPFWGYILWSGVFSAIKLSNATATKGSGDVLCSRDGGWMAFPLQVTMPLMHLSIQPWLEQSQVTMPLMHLSIQPWLEHLRWSCL